MKNYKEEWFGNVKSELIAGTIVCLALIPEAIGFTIVAGVDPMVGVYSCFCMSVISALFGGRTGMISAAAGSMALVLASLVTDYGVEYMLLATIFTGVFQIIFGILKIGRLLKFIPQPVMNGFVNALGIMMFKAQLEHFKGSYILIFLALIGIAIIYLLPKFTKIIPSPIAAIIVITLIVFSAKMHVTTLGDMGEVNTNLPRFLVPRVPFSLDTFKIVLPYSLSLSIVGLVESLLTAQLVDEITDTVSDKNRECIGQGLANITTGFFGGIAGCGMIGQTVLNQEYGGRGRLSTFTAGTLMLGLVIVFNGLFRKVPVISLATVMVVVAISTFNWRSLKRINKVPITDSIVMIVTVIIVILTNNLAYGVIIGIVLSSIFFVSKVSNIQVERILSENELKYIFKGALFFASTAYFKKSFYYDETVKKVEIDFTNMRIYDESAVEALEKVVKKYEENGVVVKMLGLSEKDKKIVYNISKD